MFIVTSDVLVCVRLSLKLIQKQLNLKCHITTSVPALFFPSNASQKISPAAVFSSPPLPNTQTQPTAHRFLLSRLYFFFSRPLVFPAVCKCIAVRTRTHTAHGASVLVVILTSSRNRITGRGPLGAEESVKSDCFGRLKKIGPREVGGILNASTAEEVYRLGVVCSGDL